ncbi:MAG: hypothetical protein KDA21_09930, partial [Phycisphaerales bacterium]|nr:hypothetical protein [Phycisphaerales bacterium]
MSRDHLVLGTRKGVIIAERRNGDWHITHDGLHGIPVPYATLDPRTGTLWATLDHGHWGQKLNRSRDMGRTWEEVTAPKYPEGAMVKPDVPATCRYLWVFQPGPASQPGRLYIGTEPGGLFVSDDDGETWTLNEPLWNLPERPEGWFGGGRDFAGIHSILVDPRDSKRVLIGISCAGVIETTNGGATWNLRNRGLSADFLPDPNAEVGQDPHFVSWCPNDPDKVWQQNHCGIFFSSDGAKEWKKVSTDGALANFGFAVAVDENDGNTALVVPADSDGNRVAKDGALAVCRSSDGGQT